MALLDHLTPTYYKITRLGIQQINGELAAVYDVRILNADGRTLETMPLTAGLTAQEKSVILAAIARDKTTFETATGLTEWTE